MNLIIIGFKKNFYKNIYNKICVLQQGHSVTNYV